MGTGLARERRYACTADIVELDVQSEQGAFFIFLLFLFEGCAQDDLTARLSIFDGVAEPLVETNFQHAHITTDT